MRDREDQITLDILRAERRYNVFKTIILTAVVVAASATVVWQVNSKVNQSHQLLRCQANAIATATDGKTFQQSIKDCLNKDVTKQEGDI